MRFLKGLQNLSPTISPSKTRTIVLRADTTFSFVSSQSAGGQCRSKRLCPSRMLHFPAWPSDNSYRMPRRVWIIVAFLLLLLPSAQFAWRNRDMPNFGYLHDDALMFVTAQGIAQGNGYRISSLPEAPYQTKYPPLYS